MNRFNNLDKEDRKIHIRIFKRFREIFKNDSEKEIERMTRNWVRSGRGLLAVREAWGYGEWAEW